MSDSDKTKLNSGLLPHMDVSSTAVELYYKEQTFSIRIPDMPFAIGRDPKLCQLAAECTTASRHHCTIEMENGQVGISDHSTNGTVVKVGKGNSLLIKGRFFPLSGQGCFNLGADVSLGDPDLIYYKLIHRSNL